MVQHSLGRPVPRRPELAAAPADFQDAPGAPDVGEHGDNPVTWHWGWSLDGKSWDFLTCEHTIFIFWGKTWRQHHLDVLKMIV